MDSWQTSLKVTVALMFMGLILAFPNQSLQAAQADPYKDGPVHEAFLTSSTEGGVVLQSIAKVPPSPINEQQPAKCHSEAIWIEGYWSWVHKIDDFVWVSGVWRRPPPGHVWISGYWKKFDAGWAWVRGFWSTLSEHDIKYIDTPPPNPKEQQISTTPGENYFWMAGYWNYDTNKYNWLNGQWIELDANWIYVPAYYLWRPGGYIFIPGYWDLPIESRGCAYSSVMIPAAARSTIIYTPSIVLQPEVIIRWAFLYFPDHTIFFWHHRHFHPGFWDSWCCVPPWWHWNSCWCFNWGDTWGLWWWWTNPGFQHPWWLLFSMANHIPPPPWLLLNRIQNIMPPPIITPFGAVPPLALIDAIRGGLPIMPNDPKDLEEIFDKLKPLFPNNQTPLRPNGNESDLDKPLPRPDLGDKPEADDTMVTPPPKPPSAKPPITHPPESYIPKPPSVVAPPILPPRPPTYFPSIPKPPIYHPIRPQAHPRPHQRPHPRPHQRPHPRPHPRPHHNPWMNPKPEEPGERIPWPQPDRRPPSQTHPSRPDTNDSEMDPRPGGSNYNPPSSSHYPRIRQGQQNQRIQRGPQIQRGNWNQPRFNPNRTRRSQRGPMQRQPKRQRGSHGEFQ